MNKRDKGKLIFDKLKNHYGQLRTALQYENKFQLLVAIILSAQTTDKQVNRVTEGLFLQFPEAEKLATACEDEVIELIKGTGLYRNKARALIAAARMLMEEFGGEIPDSREDLMRLPGIGRKGANVMLSVGFNKPAFAVDTHVFRVLRRLGLSKGKTHLEVEDEVVGMFPEEEIIDLHHLLIAHGRKTCNARKPSCEMCPVKKECKSYPLS